MSGGIITNPKTNDGYGLIHIEARHGAQIRSNGYKSVLEFIEAVAQNWSIIREGKDRDSNRTYRLITVDIHNNTLMVELSGDGTYWNINTAGIFKNSYGKNNREIYNRHTTANQSTETNGVSQGAEQSGTTASSGMITPISDGKVNTSSTEKQISGEESSLQPSDDKGAGLEGDSRGAGNGSQHERNLPQEVSSAERTEMQSRIVDWLSDDNLSKGIGNTRSEIFEEFGNKPEPIAYIPTEFLRLVDPNLSDPRIYCGKGYFIDHALHNHAQEGHQIDVNDVDVSKYLNIQTVLDNPDSIKETFVDGKRSVVFIKKIGRYFAELTQVEEGGKIILHKSTFNQKKEPYAKLNDIRRESSSSEGGTSSISHADKSAPAISLESRGDDVSSDGKVNTLSTEKQISGEESSLQPADDKGAEVKQPSVQESVQTASAEVNTEPTPAQAEAGNYKKGHDAPLSLSDMGATDNSDSRPHTDFVGVDKPAGRLLRRRKASRLAMRTPQSLMSCVMDCTLALERAKL